MQISPRKAGYVTGAIAIVIGGWLGIDSLVVTDEEQIEELANDVTGVVDPARVRASLEKWTDPATRPVEVRAFGRVEVYDASRAAELESAARDALRSYQGERLRKMRQGIRIDGDRATLTLRIVSTRGMVDADFELEKHGDRWIVAGVDVHR